MKIKYPSIFGVLAILMLVASFVVPARLASPAPVEAINPVCQWDVIVTPGMIAGLTFDLLNPSEVTGMAIGADGKTFWAWDTAKPIAGSALGTQGSAYKTTNGGISWSDRYAGQRAADGYLYRDMLAAGIGSYPVWNMVMAPDDVNFVVAVVDKAPLAGAPSGPGEVYISTDGGLNWQNTNFGATVVLPAGDYISCVDVSMMYGTARDVVVGTRNGDIVPGVANGNVYVLKAPSFSSWRAQISGLFPLWDGSTTADVFAVKCSPTYVGDATIVAVMSPDLTIGDTFLYMGYRDLAITNPTTNWAGFIPVEIKDPTHLGGWSLGTANMVTADLELPSDFSGQSASMRRAYVSIDGNTNVDNASDSGIFRIDDTTVYMLMSTSGMFLGSQKRISSIAYWGTYASGKLLAGEVMGYACTATVPTWFTDSPTVCPIPCWYPALKPTTGAAGCGVSTLACTTANRGFGNAQVAWNPIYADQGVAYVGTSAHSLSAGGTVLASVTQWPGALNVWAIYDESAFGLTRNNGETWNQISFIDTFIYKFTDVAPAPDCTTVYLASTNNWTACVNTPAGGVGCLGFDSVWRSGTNAAVVMPPLPGLPLGSYWERVFTHVTAPTCLLAESQHAILRLAPDKFDGQIVFWGAGGNPGAAFAFPILAGTPGFTTGGLTIGANTMAAFWTPDYGDYWAQLTPRIPIEDMSAASSTLLYVLDTGGRIQKMPYTGTAWSSAEQTKDAFVRGHMILARYDTLNKATSDWVLVGDNAAFAALAPVTWSKDQYTTYGYTAVPTGDRGRVHVAFDSLFESNSTFYIGFDGSGLGQGGVYRFAIGKSSQWDDLMNVSTAFGTFHNVGIYGLMTAITGATGIAPSGGTLTGSGALYAAHMSTPLTIAGGLITAGAPAGVDRTIEPLSGVPKPGITWDCLNWFSRQPGLCLPVAIFPGWGVTTFGTNGIVQFTEEPWSLKLCGCLTIDTNTNLFAIDNSNAYVTYVTGFAPACPGARGPGMGDVWMFEDCMAKKGPKLTMADKALIGCDPVSGRNQEINFTWEQLCIAVGYDIEIAKDAAWTLRVFDWVPTTNPLVTAPNTVAAQFGFQPSVLTSPAFIFPTGGGPGPGAWGAVAPNLVSTLECGHTYYWRVEVRQCATGQIIRSPWSEVRSFTVKAGLPVVMPYYGLQLLAPNNGSLGIPVKPVSFSWSPYMDTTKYEFVLAKDPAMTQVVVTAQTATTGYVYTAGLDFGQSYFWRVRSVEPSPSDWSATFSFMTAGAPAPPAAPAAPPATPIWVWVVIAIGAILVIVTLVLIFKTRRV